MTGPNQPRLPDRYPRVAATWHDLRNGCAASEFASTDPNIVWWRCTQGHEWLQSIASRTHLPAWKQGDFAACRECLEDRYWGQFACGHHAWFRDGRSRDQASSHLCRPCGQDLSRQEHNAAILEEVGVPALLEALAQPSLNHAALQDIEFDPEATPPFVGNWRSASKLRLQDLRHTHGHLTPTTVQEALEELRIRARNLTPTSEGVDEALAANELVLLPLTPQRMWPGGWLWHQHATAQPAALPGEETRVATAIAETINAWATQAGQNRTHWSTRELTAELTQQAIQVLTRHDPTGRVHREALIPLTRPGGVKLGAVDLVACRTDAPDVVVELDSRPKTWSARKLAYARQAGAITVWIRFDEGGVSPQPEGTLVVDARATTAALVCGRFPSASGAHVVDRDDAQMSLFSLSS